MAGMLDRLFDEKAKKIQDDFEKRLGVMERLIKERFDGLDKKIDEMVKHSK